MKEKNPFLVPEIEIINVELSAGYASPSTDPKDTDPYIGEIDHNT